jgi:hypothetical protein
MAAAAEAAQRSAEAEAARLAALEEAKAVALSMVPEEPPADAAAADIADLRLVALDGSSSNHRVFRHTTTAALYNLARAGPTHGGAAFQLFAGFPPKAVEESDVLTVGEVKALVPRAVVTMRTA